MLKEIEKYLSKDEMKRIAEDEFRKEIRRMMREEIARDKVNDKDSKKVVMTASWDITDVMNPKCTRCGYISEKTGFNAPHECPKCHSKMTTFMSYGMWL